MTDTIQNLSESEIWPESAVFGVVTYAPGAGFGPRVQADVQLVVADAGSIRLESDGQALRLEPGEVVCQWPGAAENWRFDAEKTTTHRWVALTFPPDPATGTVLAGWAAAAPRTRPESPALAALLAAGTSLRGDASAGAAAARRRLAAACLRGFLEAGAPAPGKGDPAGGVRLPPPLRAMQGHIAVHAAEPLALADLAAAAHVTPSHLVRLSREHLGITPVALLWETRVRRGLDLLKNTGLSVSEIADQAGFASAFHFSRRVKQATGKPPRELRG